MQRILLAAVNLGLAIGGVIPPASPDVFYSATLTGYGGIEPYEWAVIGGYLPSGFSSAVDSEGRLVISGTTSEVGDFLFTVFLRDSSGKSTTKPFRLRVVALPLIISDPAPDGTIGVPYSHAYAVEGGLQPYAFSINSGALPDGLSLNALTGEITGTPTTGQTRSFTIEVVDSNSPQASSRIEDGITIAFATLAVTGSFGDTAVGSPLAGTPLIISGGDGSYSLSGAPYSGTRPAGVTIAVVGNELRATGNTTTSASYSWTERVLSGDGQHFDVVCAVDVLYPTLVVTGTFTNANQGSPLGGTPLPITGGNGSYGLSGSPYSGTRPPGPTFSVVGSNLVASGNTTTAGSYSWTERVTSGDGQHFDVASSVVITATDPSFASVTSLIHFDGLDTSTTIVDQITKTWTANGNAQLDTAQKLFGTASGLFDGNGDYWRTTSVSGLGYGASQDFTIEFAVRFNSVSSRQIFIGANGGNIFYFDFRRSGTNVMSFAGPGGSVFNGVTTLSTGTWYRIAVTRIGSTIRLFVNGVVEVTNTAVGNLTGSGTQTSFDIGCCPAIGGASLGLNGWIDEFRFTKGVGRYSANYTPDTAEFPNS